MQPIHIEEEFREIRRVFTCVTNYDWTIEWDDVQKWVWLYNALVS